MFYFLIHIEYGFGIYTIIYLPRITMSVWILEAYGHIFGTVKTVK